MYSWNAKSADLVWMIIGDLLLMETGLLYDILGIFPHEVKVIMSTWRGETQVR